MSEIVKTFSGVVASVKKEATAVNHTNAIDIELTFEKVKISNGGIPLISKRSDREDIKIRLATTVTI